MTEDNAAKVEDSLPQHLSAEGVMSFLSPDFPGTIIFKEVTGSTNDDAREYAGFADWAVVIADEQRTGRGRQGNSFYSPKGTGLYLSVAVSVPSENIFRVTPTVAVAVCKTLEKCTGTHPKIKWVNDILIDNKKVCGILCETVPGTGAIVIGVGINLTTETFPEELTGIAGNVVKGFCNRNVIAAELITQLYTLLQNCDFIEEYRARSAVIGKTIRYKENNTWSDADALGIAENGGLIISEKGQIRTLTSGEISVRF